jgi:hypothetical protein
MRYRHGIASDLFSPLSQVLGSFTCFRSIDHLQPLTEAPRSASSLLASLAAESLLVFLIFLAAYRDRDHVEAATSSKLTIGTGDQDDAIALALASNMTATDLDVSEMTVSRHRCQRLAHSHTLKIHDWVPSVDRKRGKSLTRNSMTALT